MVKRIKDIRRLQEIVNYGRKWYEKSIYNTIGFDENVSRETIRAGICYPTQALWVSETDGVIQGFLLGGLCSFPFSKKNYATDILFCADAEGAKLFSAFQSWAIDQKAILLQMGVTSGIGDPEAIGKFYKINGFSHVGGIYFKELTHERDSKSS